MSRIKVKNKNGEWVELSTEACFTKLVGSDTRELKKEENGGSVTELASYPLLPIIKLFGTDYKDLTFDSFRNNEGVDLYTKIYLKYPKSVATAKVGLGVKSEGDLIISGTNGYIYVAPPWWKTQYFEVRHENIEENEKFFAKFLGDGLRYALSDFVSVVNGNTKKSNKLTDKESIAISKIIDKFLKNEVTNNMPM